MPSVKEIYHFDELTWPEVNEAVEMGKIPIIPTGAVEQHGHHLPLKVDHLCANAVATEAARLKAEFALVLPPVSYGYVHHVMDFPGSINIHHEHFIQYVLGITKSLAYHGFKKMIILNGHGSNHNLVDMVARRTIVETDASCTFTSWWQLLKVHPGFDEKWRESVFPGGCSHAGELETSMLLHLSPESVRKDKIKSEIAKTNQRGSQYIWGDLFGKSAMGLIEWTSQYSDSGVMGEAEKATAEKGKIVFEEASKNLAEFIEEYHGMEIAERTSHHAKEPTFPLSFPTD
ncbi:MAG TPA: creatininase family protein [Candidatus Latescibacteria bacterium]|nr:creatininase family protein [Candidatus Handelsmanbacteria bacterium]HIL11241.1 creatininase family protein [Candidatus Latescibacterota bacterium]